MTLPDTLPELITLLDSLGFDYGKVRISVWRAILVVVVILAVLMVARLLSSGVRRVFRKATRLDATQQLLGEKIVGVWVWTVCILFGVDILGIDLTAFTIFSGAFGLAVGFGLQKTFGNLLAGIILLMDRSIKPGDVIAINDGTGTAVGQVKKIGMRAVSVTTRDKKEYLIPNENLMINQVENWSYSSREVRLKVPVSVDYASDIIQVEQLLLQAAGQVPRILKRPAPTVWVTSFGDNGIHFELQVWISDPEQGIGDVRSDVLKTLWKIFKENKVRVSFPQREITVKSAGGEEAKGKAKSLP